VARSIYTCAARRSFGRRSLIALDEVEEQIANMVPITIVDCLVQLRLLKERWTSEPIELDDRLVANLLAGVEVMATAGG
jgi:hypothetical protein